MKRMLLFFGILLFTTGLLAQNKETVFGYSGLKLTGIWGGPSFGGTGIGDNTVYLRGGFGGLEFNKSITIAYAAYWLNEKASLDQFPNQGLDFSYRGGLLGYAFQSKKIVHPKLSVLIGGGELDLDDEDTDKVFIVQPAAGIEINVFKWFHVDVLGGYRFANGINIDGLSNSDVSTPFGEVKLRFGISWGWY